MKLLTNNPKKRTALIGYGLEITKTVPKEVECNIHNEDSILYTSDAADEG